MKYYIANSGNNLQFAKEKNGERYIISKQEFEKAMCKDFNNPEDGCLIGISGLTCFVFAYLSFVSYSNKEQFKAIVFLIVSVLVFAMYCRYSSHKKLKLIFESTLVSIKEYLTLEKSILNSSTIWYIEGQTSHSNPKYHSGASYQISRTECSRPSVSSRTYINCPYSSIHINNSSTSFFFFPRLVFLCNQNSVRVFSYDDISINCSTTRMIEECPPKDSTVVEQVYKHPNVSGGPDLRYSDNYLVPVCLYRTVTLAFRSSRSYTFHFSNTNVT